MDIFTHALIGAAVAPNKELAWPMAVSGIIPDLWNVPPMVEYIVRRRGRYDNAEYWQWIPRRYDELTRWSHSLIPLVFSMVLGVWLFQLTPWLWVPWFFHLLIDIPTHQNSRTGMLWYPIYRTQTLGLKNWYEMWWASIVAIVTLGAFVFLRFGR